MSMAGQPWQGAAPSLGPSSCLSSFHSRELRGTLPDRCWPPWHEAVWSWETSWATVHTQHRLGVSHSSLHRTGKFYPLHLGSLPFRERDTLGPFSFKNWANLFGGLCMGMEVEFCSYTSSDLLFVGPHLLFVCMCVLVLALAGWDVSGLWALTTAGHSFLLHWHHLWWSISWEFPFQGLGNCDPERPRSIALVCCFAANN